MRKIPVPEDNIETLFGSYDENLRQLESTFGVQIRTQGHDLLVDGSPADEEKVARTVNQLTALMREGYRVSNGEVKTAAQLVRERLILEALALSHGVKSRAAALLGLNRTTLVEKIRRNGLESEAPPEKQQTEPERIPPRENTTEQK